MLDGLAYVEESQIYYLNLIDLPDDVERRFKFLFEKHKIDFNYSNKDGKNALHEVTI
jgi:hypothetical protein